MMTSSLSAECFGGVAETIAQEGAILAPIVTDVKYFVSGVCRKSDARGNHLITTGAAQIR
jgi:hypothetical protein